MRRDAAPSRSASNMTRAAASMRPGAAIIRLLWSIGISAAVAQFSGCVSAPVEPTGPVPTPDTTVYFYPSRGQSAEQQDRDRYECNRWAVEKSGFDPSVPGIPPHLHVPIAAGPPPGSGVAAGAITGAVVGAAVSRPWESGEGAIIGAIAGAVIGGAAESAARANAEASGRSAAENARVALFEQKARDFRRAMAACLEGRGYNVR